MVCLSHLVTSSLILQVLPLLLLYGVECDVDNDLHVGSAADCYVEYQACQDDPETGGGQVCGTDGQEYLSICNMLYRSCIGGNDVKMAYPGKCFVKYVESDGEFKLGAVQENTKETSSSSEESTTVNNGKGGEIGSEYEDDENEGESGDYDDSEDSSETIPVATPVPSTPPPDSLPPAPSYCLQNPSEGPIPCKPCKESFPRQPPDFTLDFPDRPTCPQLNSKCASTRTVVTVVTDFPEIPASQSAFPTGASIVLAFGSIGIVSALAVVAFREYKKRTSRNTQSGESAATEETVNQTEMAVKADDNEKRSGSVQTGSTTV